MDRRTFLAAAAAGFVGAAAPAAGVGRRFVTSDTDPLRRVLIYPPCPRALGPGPEEAEDGEVAPDVPPWAEGAAQPLWAEGAAQHRQFAGLLAGGRGDVEVVALDRLLDGAIARCREAGRLGDWVLGTFPGLAGREAEITAAHLVGAAGEPAVAMPDDEDDPPALPRPLPMMFFARDLAAMTPRGLVLGHFINEDRAMEVALLRFAREWSPELRGYPIAFDAAKARTYVQGGDVIVADERTLLLGVGNLTDRAAAPRLARALDLDVVSVQLPGARGGDRRPGGVAVAPWDGLRTLFLHLDTVCGLLGRRSVITVPYVFEAEYAGRDTIRTLAAGFRKASRGAPVDVRRTERVLAEVGRVRRFRAGSGEPDGGVEGMKLVDYLRTRGYTPTFVGGEPPRDVDPDQLRERVLPELGNQAANVVALGPGRVIAYAGNEHTLRAVRAAGVDVATFPGSALAHWHGGPHCLTLPLERSAPDGPGD